MSATSDLANPAQPSTEPTRLSLSSSSKKIWEVKPQSRCVVRLRLAIVEFCRNTLAGLNSRGLPSALAEALFFMDQPVTSTNESDNHVLADHHLAKYALCAFSLQRYDPDRFRQSSEVPKGSLQTGLTDRDQKKHNESLAKNTISQ